MKKTKQFQEDPFYFLHCVCVCTCVRACMHAYIHFLSLQQLILTFPFSSAWHSVLPLSLPHLLQHPILSAFLPAGSSFSPPSLLIALISVQLWSHRAEVGGSIMFLHFLFHLHVLFKALQLGCQSEPWKPLRTVRRSGGGQHSPSRKGRCSYPHHLMT